jgi:hypothetical protein
LEAEEEDRTLAEGAAGILAAEEVEAGTVAEDFILEEVEVGVADRTEEADATNPHSKRLPPGDACFILKRCPNARLLI